MANSGGQTGCSNEKPELPVATSLSSLTFCRTFGMKLKADMICFWQYPDSLSTSSDGCINL